MSLHPSSSLAGPLRSVSLFVVCVSLCLAFPALGAEPIGTVTAIEGSATSEVGGRPSPLSVGDAVRLNETVRTDAAGKVKVRFVDGTDLSIGPSSSVTLDRFVWGNSDSSTVISPSRGTFFIRTPRSGEYEIRTPSATIGTRG